MSQGKMESFDYEKQGLLHEMFLRQAEKSPDELAIVSPGEKKQLTYRELNEVTDVLAANLRICGVKEDSIVGIYMEKCINYSVSYIAALKAGESLDLALVDWWMCHVVSMLHPFDSLVQTPDSLTHRPDLVCGSIVKSVVSFSIPCHISQAAVTKTD